MTEPRSKRIALWSVIGFNLIFLGLPTLIVLGASFTSGEIVKFPPDGFSLRWYGKLWLLDDFKDAFLRTLYVSVVCTIVSIPAGTLAAIALARYRIRMKTAIQVYLFLPFTIPLVVSGLSMMILFGEWRILGNLWPVGVGRLWLPRDAPRSAWTQKVRGGQHHIGTTRMADDPVRGVVDAHCRVHGIENLYLAGSSVFPTAGTANPTLTLTALALRLADRIRGQFA